MNGTGRHLADNVEMNEANVIMAILSEQLARAFVTTLHFYPKLTFAGKLGPLAQNIRLWRNGLGLGLMVANTI
jgi:hypothetical protein